MVDRGDIITLNFSPQMGREQARSRPAIVVSPESFNRVTGLVSVCPITSNQKGWGFEVELTHDGSISGVILTDHLKNLDIQARGYKFVEKAKEEDIEEMLAKIKAYLF